MPKNYSRKLYFEFATILPYKSFKINYLKSVYITLLTKH